MPIQLINLLFPRSCQGCGRDLRGAEEHICSVCLIDLPHSGYHRIAENPVAQLFYGRVNLFHASSMLVFSKKGLVQKLIHRLKYEKDATTGHFLGRLASSRLAGSEFYGDVDTIVPVPLHPKKEYQRGYNQSRLIAEGIKEGMPNTRIADMLQRNVYTASQTRKGKDERWDNVKEVFSLKAGAELPPSEHLLLVDDVVTTGSTAEACASILLKAGAHKVSFLAIASGAF